jgi:hypothetical protein
VAHRGAGRPDSRFPRIDALLMATLRSLGDDSSLGDDCREKEAGSVVDFGLGEARRKRAAAGKSGADGRHELQPRPRLEHVAPGPGQDGRSHHR